MRYTVAALLSAATFTLSTFARPQPAGGSNPLAKRYASGYCGVHIVQYQKNEGPSDSSGSTSEYRLDVTLKDALQDVVGSISKLSTPGGIYNDINSQLPSVFEIEVGGVDSVPLRFQYAGQAWSSDDSQCSVGGYDNGNRNVDCGFNC